MDGALRISLKKRIPIGAGLGGGSSDAAAAMHLMARLKKLHLSDKTMHRIAIAVGSDVLFFAGANNENTAVVSGRGDRLKYIPWPFSVTYVVVYPGIHISSAWVYSQVQEVNKPYNYTAANNRVGSNPPSSSSTENKVSRYEKCVENLAIQAIDAHEFFNSLVNDLEPLVLIKYPILERIKKGLLDFGAARALMTGSGSAVFGVFYRKKDAVDAARRLRTRDWMVFVVNPVPVKQEE